MGRAILSILVGYLVTVAFVMVTFTIAFFALKNRMYQEGTYEVSTTWLLLSFALGLAGAILGGWVCGLIAPLDRRAATVRAFAVIILVVGFLMAIPKLRSGEAPTQPRTGNETPQQLAENSHEPRIAMLLNPIIGALGVWIGGSLVKRRNTQP